MPLTTRQIADITHGELHGPGDVVVHSMERIDGARRDQVTFISDEKYAAQWATSRAGAAIVGRASKIAPSNGQAIVRVDNVDPAVAKVLQALGPPAILPPEGVQPSAVVVNTAPMGHAVRVGPQCYIGHGVKL